MVVISERIPDRIEAGRVVLELHGPDHAAAIADAINDSLDHLGPWMAWAHRPTTTQEQAMRLAMVIEQARQGGDVVYSIVSRDEERILGGCGLHHRGDPGTIEIGYWLRAGETGKGYVTDAAAGLTAVAFFQLDVDLVRITCDAANARSAAVPERLGFTLVAVREEERAAPADTDRTMVWELRRAAWPESPAAAVVVTYR